MKETSSHKTFLHVILSKKRLKGCFFLKIIACALLDVGGHFAARVR